MARQGRNQRWPGRLPSVLAGLVLVAAIFMPFVPGPSMALAADSVKVLVIDKTYRNTPPEDEKLRLMERLEGELILGYSSYKGNVEVWHGKSGLYLVNEINLEHYVEGVVKAETGEDWEMEALKAQAVLVRTYVLKQIIESKSDKFHITSSVLHQVYKGLNADPGVTEAVRQTSSEVLAYGGAPIMAFYHSTSGGMTELPEEVFGQSYPYLKSVRAEARLSPLSVWARRIPLEEIGLATGTGGLTDVKVVSLTATGRAREVLLVSDSPEKIIKATELRRALGWKRLPSTAFSLEVKDGFALIEGRGYGHGVGLCQYSALEMARDGMGYREILSYFYPGTTLTTDANL